MSKVYLMRKGDSAWSPMVTDGAEEVRFDFTFDNLENPTNYVSERAFSLRLPRCAENNKFFGHFCRLDSVVVAGDYTPTEKMRYMVLDSAGLLISTGDAVVSEISRTEYVLSLVGSQARLFRRLLNAGWNTAKAAEDGEYTLMIDWLTKTKSGTMLIDGAANRLDRFLVAASWLVESPVWDWDALRTTNLKNLYSLGADFTETMAFLASLVGFAPTAQGRPKGLDTKQWLTDNGGIITFGKIFGDGVDIEDGAIEAQMGEYRSYLQQPFIYVARLWQFFELEFSRITNGYTLQLDSGWYNEGDLARLVYMLPKTYGETNYDTVTTATGAAHTANLPDGDVYDRGGIPTVSGLSDVVLSDAVTIADLSAGDAGHITVNGVLTIEYNHHLPVRVGDMNYFSWWNPIVVEVAVYSNGAEVNRRGYAIVALPEDGIVNGEAVTLETLSAFPQFVAMMDNFAAQGITIATATYQPWSFDQMPDNWQPKLAFSVKMHTNGSLEHAEVRTSVHFGTDNCPFFYANPQDGSLYNYYRSSSGAQQTLTATIGDVTVQSGTNKRSGSVLSLETLFGEMSPFDVLLQFSKQRHLLWLVDNHAMTVRVVEAKKFFAEASANITDLSGNVDMSELKVSPISWDSHEVVFNTGSLKGDGIDGYKERHDIEYGSLLIKTQNNLNRTRKELIKSPLPASAVMSETYADPLAIVMTPDKLTYIEGFPMPLNVSNGESADNSGNFYYRHYNGTWADTYRGAVVVVSDDAPREVADDVYVYHNIGITPEYAVTARPVFSTVSDGGLSVLFAPVREQYTSMPDMPTAYLYERYWQKYVEEVYNAQNKTLEVDIYLPRAVFDRVRQNPLVVIDHVPYLLTNIDGWGEHNTVCRCTLRQITNINNLKS